MLKQLQECRKQQINEDLYNKLIKEFNQVPCIFGIDNCKCEYIIKNKKITRAAIYESVWIKPIANLKRALKDPNISEPDKIKIKEELKITRDLRDFKINNDFIKLAENLYENYKNARLNRLERENKKLKPSDSYSWNQLTRPEKSDWVLAATMFYSDYLILKKNGTTNNINKKEEIQ